MPNTRSGASVTYEEVEELVTRRVAEEMEAREAARTLEPLNENGDEQEGENGGNGNGGNGHRNGNHGTEGVVGLTCWFEKMESVFNISNCPPKYQVKYATCTLHVTPSKSGRSGKGYAARSAENKRRMESNLRDNRGQQPPFKRQNTSGKNMARAYTTGKMKERGAPSGNQQGIICYECGRPGHFRKDYHKLRSQNRGNQARNKNGNKTGNQTGGHDATRKLLRPCGSKLNIISCTKTQKYIAKDQVLSGTSLRQESARISRRDRLEDVPIIHEFSKVFPEDLSGLPPARQVEFQIDLVPGAAPVVRAPYRLAPAEMQELSTQLQELSDKGFIRQLPEKLSRVHSTFYVSKLKKCMADKPFAIPLDEIQVDDKLNFIEEPVEILDREVKRLKQSRIPIVKVRWNSRRGPDLTWECEDQMQKKYPHLFTNSAPAAEVAS
ncbi:putative reverse transcriptase domain-containing protein [Tanacetum coccineum]